MLGVSNFYETIKWDSDNKFNRMRFLIDFCHFWFWFFVHMHTCVCVLLVTLFSSNLVISLAQTNKKCKKLCHVLLNFLSFYIHLENGLWWPVVFQNNRCDSFSCLSSRRLTHFNHSLPFINLVCYKCVACISFSYRCYVSISWRVYCSIRREREKSKQTSASAKSISN